MQILDCGWPAHFQGGMPHNRDCWRKPTREEWVQYGREQGWIDYMLAGKTLRQIERAAVAGISMPEIQWAANKVLDAALGVSDE